MRIEPPQVLLDVVASFDASPGIFSCADVGREAHKAVEGIEYPDEDARKSTWAEWAPWEFSTHEAANGGPWNTYFQPKMMGSSNDGEYRARPDLRTATPDILHYWSERAEKAKHPVIKARYADLVWDTTRFATNKKPDIKFARIAIDSYVAAAALDPGTEKFDTQRGLTRALHLAMKVQDGTRVATVVSATTEFVKRTAEDDHVGTYCYLFDNLLPPEKGPTISAELEREVIAFFEAKFAALTVPGSRGDLDPHSPQDVGLRLAAYYARTGAKTDRSRVLRTIAAAFERRAAISEPLIGMHDLQRAGELYMEAGLRHETDRVWRQGQELGLEANKSMEVLETSVEVPADYVEQFEAIMSNLGIPMALEWLTRHFVPNQDELAVRERILGDMYPLQALFKPVILAADHIVADVGDDGGDIDGSAVERTSRYLRTQQIFLQWGFDYLFNNMLMNVNDLIQFIGKSPLYTDDRLPIVRSGLQAHVDRDYLKSVSVLVPQIENAIVNLLRCVGSATVKPHQSGRGVMQQKALNDVLRHPNDRLANARVVDALGPDLRIYLVATLSHPKGLNIRNLVCHGLLSADSFTKVLSERVLHALFAVALLRKADPPPDAGTGPSQAPMPDPVSSG